MYFFERDMFAYAFASLGNLPNYIVKPLPLLARLAPLTDLRRGWDRPISSEMPGTVRVS